MSLANKSQQAMFTEQWNIYQKVIANNFMYHTEIIDIVGRELEKYEKPSILDLGCGDSYVISQSIAGNQKIDYRGIDSAMPALEHGKDNLKFVDGKIDLINTDLLTELQSCNQLFDVILLGYSLHHLSAADKQQCFSLLSGLIADNGVVILYDLEMSPGEIRSAYIKRACTLFIHKWHGFDDHSMQSITAHVEENDIPENEQFYVSGFERAGFSRVNKEFRDPDNLFSVYTCTTCRKISY